MDTLASICPAKAGWLRDSDLAPFADAYCRRLLHQGYAERTVRAYVNGFAHFARWKGRRRRASAVPVDEDIRLFLDDHLPRCACPPPVQRCRHQIRAALRHLSTVLCGVGAPIGTGGVDIVDEELRHFDEYMLKARGLARNTRVQRLHILRPFLDELTGVTRTGLREVTPEKVRSFYHQKLQSWSPASAKVLAGALRSYIRFRAACGDQVEQLLPVIASSASWRLASLPETLSPVEVTRLIQSIPADTPSALRAHAMVRCVVDLGLRASEVAGLGLDDIYWDVGTIRIGRSKARRVDILPLPAATGRAIGDYLRRERPRCDSRFVFVRHVAPVEKPIGPGVVRRAVREVYRRCGIRHTRVHILRHTLAKRLLDGGGTLKEVADMLRHPRARHVADLRQGRHTAAIGGGVAVAWERAMSAPISLQAAVQRYLEERRHLGFEIRISGGQLLRFGRFADARRHRGPLTLALQFAWARQHVRHTSSMTAARRLEILRPFVKYYRQFEPESVVPDQTALGRAHRRLTPHIYTEKEVIDLLHAAGGLDPQGGLRPATYKTLFGLIASTGLRLSEALNLRARDIDLDDGALTIRQTTFAKSRRLPIHPSVVQELRTYHAMWGRGDIRDHDTPFFVSTTGRALPKRDCSQCLRAIEDAIGMGGTRRASQSAHPRSSPYVRRAAREAVARRRIVDRPGDVPALHLPRPRQDLRHLLVPVRCAGP